MKKILTTLAVAGLLASASKAQSQFTNLGSLADEISVLGKFRYTDKYVRRGSFRTEAAIQSDLQISFPAVDGSDVYLRFFVNSPIDETDNVVGGHFYRSTQTIPNGSREGDPIPASPLVDEDIADVGHAPTREELANLRVPGTTANADNTMLPKITMYYPLNSAQLEASSDERADANVNDFGYERLSVEFRTELDTTLGISHWLSDQLLLDLGYTYYYYSKSGNAGTPYAAPIDSSSELFVGILFEVFLAPEIYVSYDFDLEQIAIEGEIEYTYEVGDGFSIKLGAQAGYISAGDYTQEGHKTSYVYYGANVDFILNMSENTSVILGLNYIINDGEDEEGKTELFVDPSGENSSDLTATDTYFDVGGFGVDPVNRAIHPGLVQKATNFAFTIGFKYIY